MLKLASILLFILLSSPASSFGFKAHQIVAQIAQNHLSVEAKAAITDILQGESLGSASTWADEMRHSNKGSKFWSYNYSSNWHFVNVEANVSYQESQKNRQGDAYIALLALMDILENKASQGGIIETGIALYLKENNFKDQNIEHKQLALKFLLHIVGDLHQPLHVGYKEDRGGNEIEVRWMNQKTNLHSVWDTRLVEYQALSVIEFEQKLMNIISTMKPEEISKIQQSNAIEWVNEGLLIRDDIYDLKPYKGRLNKDYAEEFTPILEHQLIKAGLRLAETLNNLFK